MMLLSYRGVICKGRKCIVIAVSGAVIDNALRASPLAEFDQNRLVGRTGLFKRVVRRERTGARSIVK